ncbi:MAG: ImmA/IrrE family metallo-endopeptidase [Deltaproteobacteria bacterium]|nr:ImmA/IrrE family metallo-endopeptidase [Deltaproteobacteria bacterium]
MGSGKKVPVVPGKSWAEIGLISLTLIQTAYPELLVKPAPLPLDDFFEFKMKGLLGYDYDINDLPLGIEAAMDPQEKLVILSPETYDDLTDGLPRARFTVAHEIGHVVLHAKFLRHRLLDGGNILKLHRGDIPAFRDPECQANAFAAAFLMPTHHVDRMVRKGADIGALVETFGVSWESAEYRLKNLWRYKK